MERVGVRELRQNASEVLRRVERGETIEVTDRGRPVARMVPIRHTSRLEQLIAEGRIGPAEGDILDVEPIEWPPGVLTPLQALEELRRDER